VSLYSDLILATSGLISYWRLSDTSGAATDEKGLVNGTYNGSVTRDATGLLTNDADTAAGFPGTAGNYISVPSNAAYDTGAQMTLECWMKASALPGVSQKIIARSSASTNWFLEITSGNAFRWYTRDANTTDTYIDLSGGGGPPTSGGAGQVYHVVGTYNAAGVIKLYVNGVSLGTPNRTPNANLRSGTAQSIAVGAVSASVEPFNGTVDEVAIYNVALTPAQVLDHYNAGVGKKIYADSPSGSLVLSGTRMESWAPTYRDSPSGRIAWTGSVVENAGLPVIYSDLPSGSIGVSGSLSDLLAVPGGWSQLRQYPPLRLHVDAIVPNGRHYRWGSDEPDPQNAPTGLRFSSTMPGGFESMDCVLARNPGPAGITADLERLSTLRILGSGGDIAGEYRLERTPRTSGDQMAVSPSAVGWQAHLDDNKDVKEIYVDIDLSRWGEQSAQRRLNLLAAGYAPSFPTSVVPDDTTGRPVLQSMVNGDWSAKPLSAALYRSAGITIGSVYYAWKIGSTIVPADGNWAWEVLLTIDDVLVGIAGNSGNLRAAGPGSGTLVYNGDVRTEYATLQQYYAAASTGHQSTEYPVYWTCLAVYGAHNLTKRGTASATQAQGFYASDIIAHAVAKYAPMLVIGDESIQQSSFVIPQMAFVESTTVTEIVRQATRFNLADWGVWEGREFQWYERNTRGRRWRARIAPAQLEETGPQVDRLWESVVVQFADVDGSPKTVGPPGSLADTESALLKDTDPENPANKLGIIRRSKLTMGVSTPAAAIEVGRRFLEEQKLLDRSGRARIVGYVTDDRGTVHPYWRIRAGDLISFTDASDTSYRRIVKVDHDVSTRTASLDLDAPPEGLDALLERLGVAIVSLGFS